jgi:hypothetical protein
VSYDGSISQFFVKTIVTMGHLISLFQSKIQILVTLPYSYRKFHRGKEIESKY